MPVTCCWCWLSKRILLRVEMKKSFLAPVQSFPAPADPQWHSSAEIWTKIQQLTTQNIKIRRAEPFCCQTKPNCFTIMCCILMECYCSVSTSHRCSALFIRRNTYWTRFILQMLEIDRLGPVSLFSSSWGYQGYSVTDQKAPDTETSSCKGLHYMVSYILRNESAVWVSLPPFTASATD